MNVEVNAKWAHFLQLPQTTCACWWKIMYKRSEVRSYHILCQNFMCVLLM